MMAPDLLRRALLVTLACGLPASPARAETALPRPASLSQVAQLAALGGNPLVLLVSLSPCGYCEQVRRSHLLPMAAQGMPVFQLDIGSRARVVDFSASPRTHDDVIDTLDARFAPTVLFLDPLGREIAERLVGAGLADFYGALLDRRLQAARERLRER